MKLNELDNFQKARIIKVDDSPAGRRLAVLGCCEGASIKIVRRTMMGDTLACELSNYTFGLRKDEAELITIEVL